MDYIRTTNQKDPFFAEATHQVDTAVVKGVSSFFLQRPKDHEHGLQNCQKPENLVKTLARVCTGMTD